MQRRARRLSAPGSRPRSTVPGPPNAEKTEAPVISGSTVGAAGITCVIPRRFGVSFRATVTESEQSRDEPGTRKKPGDVALP